MNADFATDERQRKLRAIQYLNSKKRRNVFADTSVILAGVLTGLTIGLLWVGI